MLHFTCGHNVRKATPNAKVFKHKCYLAHGPNQYMTQIAGILCNSVCCSEFVADRRQRHVNEHAKHLCRTYPHIQLHSERLPRKLMYAAHPQHSLCQSAFKMPARASKKLSHNFVSITKLPSAWTGGDFKEPLRSSHLSR